MLQASAAGAERPLTYDRATTWGWASLAIAAKFLEKPQQIAMEENRWDQPEIRENI
jgi:hypothetical protein